MQCEEKMEMKNANNITIINRLQSGQQTADSSSREGKRRVAVGYTVVTEDSGEAAVVGLQRGGLQRGAE
jgi:hypothetical protein